MKKRLDVENWVRKPHFEFFNRFEEPFHGVCVTVDCSKAYRFSKESGISVFLYQLYQSLSAAQAIEPLKQRIEGDEVFVYEQIDGAATVARANGTFGYGHFPYHSDLDRFLETSSREVERVRQGTDLVPSSVANVIRYSAIPWIDFTSLSHARMFSRRDSVPCISFGKITEKSGTKQMPVSIHVHHGVVDGLQVSQYIDHFQELLNSR